MIPLGSFDKLPKHLTFENYFMSITQYQASPNRASIPHSIILTMLLYVKKRRNNYFQCFKGNLCLVSHLHMQLRSLLHTIHYFHIFFLFVSLLILKITILLKCHKLSPLIYRITKFPVLDKKKHEKYNTTVIS